MKQLLHPDLWGITLANSQSNFGTALIEVFVPLFLLGLGLTLQQIALFYLCYAGFKLIINLSAIRLINRYGARPGLLLARLANCLFLLSLALTNRPLLHWVVWLAPLFLALTNAFQWGSEHLHLSRVTSPQRLGSDLARIGTATLVATAIAPVIGSAIDNFLSQAWVLLIAFMVVLTSAFWLKSVDKLAGGHTPVRHISYDLSHAPRRDLLANFGFNIHSAAGTMVWPVYLAVVLKNTAQIGIVTAIGVLVAVMVLLFAGQRSDVRGVTFVLREGSIATFIAHLLRLFAQSLSSIIGINIIWSTVSKYQLNAWTNTYYSHTR